MRGFCGSVSQLSLPVLSSRGGKTGGCGIPVSSYFRNSAFFWKENDEQRNRNNKIFFRTGSVGFPDCAAVRVHMDPGHTAGRRPFCGVRDGTDLYWRTEQGSMENAGVPDRRRKWDASQTVSYPDAGGWNAGSHCDDSMVHIRTMDSYLFAVHMDPSGRIPAWNDPDGRLGKNAGRQPEEHLDQGTDESRCAELSALVRDRILKS